MPTRTAKSKPGFVQVKEPFSGVDKEGVPFTLNREDVLSEDDPIVKRYKSMFEPLQPHRRRPRVERATAAPGERRGE